MQWRVVICWALLALVGANECPDGGRCEEGQTCCNSQANGYECCPFEQAECCGDHMHCCPAGTFCDIAKSSCVNATVYIPWAERASADKPRLTKSFRMIRTHIGQEDENICPDQSRCPSEFSCLRALTRFGCCPLAQGVPCSDGKHCCPEDLQCSADSRSCIKTELVATVICSDGVSECPDGTTCCETQDGKWGCCPMPKAVCCEDKLHCCPEGSTCDVEHSKCISMSTKKVLPMWDKLPARRRAEWENKKGEQMTAEAVDNGESEKVTTAKTVHLSEEEVTVLSVTKAAGGNDVPCDDTVACPDGTTCCKNTQGSWSCCPLPEAVCCKDFVHCCPKGKTCNLAAQTCDSNTGSVPWLKKIPAIPRWGVQARNVTCDSTATCPDGTTCCKNTQGSWACCPLPQAVCCDDHEHCCPHGTTCDLTSLKCQSTSGSTPMKTKTPAFTTVAPTTAAPTTQSSTVSTEEEQKVPEEDEVIEEWEEEDEKENKDVQDTVQCDSQTTCPQSTTCCFMASARKWGCCPLPEAVCCADGSHCCPNHYKCDEHQTSCIKGEVVIPWYTKLPATTSVQVQLSSKQCDDLNQCPEHTTCCQISTGEWGCCPIQNGVCCPDQEHCCPQGYTCNMDSKTCQKLQLESLPMMPVFLAEHRPQSRNIQCDEHTSCEDGQTCCKLSSSTWACCPLPNAVCCNDHMHCCPSGYSCTDTGDCTQDIRLHWFNWHVFIANKKTALIV